MSWTPPGPAWLFCPADRPERFAKAVAAADVVILDLEDGVAPADKDAARRTLVESRTDPDRTVVRINAVGDERERDLAALAKTDYSRVMAAKGERATDISALAPLQVVVLVETPRGVLAVAELAAAPNTIALMWGAEDLLAGLGGMSSRRPGGGYRDVAQHARSVVLLAAAAHDRYAIDAVHLDIHDATGLRAEAADAVAVGFTATACIHPIQVPVIRDAYRPPAATVAWAEQVLAAARTERGVFAFGGRMVDGPVLRHAEMIVRRAAQPGS